MSNTLLPCPFCGGEAEIVGGPENWTPTFYDPDSGGDPIAVVCKTCACGLHFFDGYAEAASAWNCRAQPSEKPEPLTLGELRQMGGEPIWIKEFPPYAFAGYKVLSLRVVDVYGDIVCEDGDIYEYERYGKTWLAYRSKPKEEV